MYGNPVRLHRCPECRTPHESEGLCPACAAQWEGEVEAIVAAPEAGRREARDPGHYEPRFRNPPGDSIVFIHDRVRTADGRIEERKNSWINRWGRPSNTTLARVVSDYERANPGETILDAEVRKQSGVVVARYSHRHGNPVPPSHAVHGWAKLNRISREMTGRDYRDLPDDGPEQDAVMRAYERGEDAMAAEYERHGNPTWSRDRREQFDRARREEAQGTLATDEELAEALGDLEVPPNASVSLYHTPVGDRFRVYAGNRLHETSLLRHELPAAFAAIEAEGDERHGNPVHPSARERGFARHGEGQERMTIARAREILTPLGIVIKRTDPYTDEWRVNFRGGTEGTATYETDIPSAVLTGQAMAADRARHGNPLY